MKRLLSIPIKLLTGLLKFPRLVMVTGVILLACLVWVGGPYLGIESRGTRLVLVAGILFLWILFLLFDRYRSEKSAKLLESSLQSQAQDQMASARPDRREQVEEIRQQFEKAVAALKQSRLAGGRHGSAALYALPWYMFIGPPASGKSTALEHSGLQFPYTAGGGRIKGVGGTRNCDWWFTSEAVLLDTAGRYMNEDDDRQEWFGFLDLLKKYRKAKPINGILVAISIADLVQESDEKVEEYAKNIRGRMDELIQRLGIIFPVYVIFTKCDLLRGFVEFFEDLNRAEREGIWGCTLPLKSPSDALPETLFDAGFEKLAETLYGRRTARLSSARGTQKIRDIFSFPLQLNSGRQKMRRFLEVLFQANPYQENPIFRGFYFTSATQEGAPIDRILSAISQASGLPDSISSSFEEKRETKSYFIKNLFTEVIFPDRILAGPTSRRARQQGYMRVAVFVGVVVAVAASLTGLSFSFAGNKHLVRAVWSSTEGVAKVGYQDGDEFLRHLDTLDRLRERVSQLHTYEEEGPPLRLRAGLYRGGNLYGPVRDVFFDRFNKLFIAPAKDAIEMELDGFITDPAALSGDRDTDYYYSLLKAYLMMGDTQRRDPVFLDQWLRKMWGELLLVSFGSQGLAEEIREAVDRQITFYSFYPAAQGLPKIPIENRIVRDSRRALRQVPPIERLYDRIRRQGMETLKPYTLETALMGRKQDLLVSAYEIPGLFTLAASKNELPQIMEGVLEASVQESWVLGEEPMERSRMVEGIKAFYFEEYAGHWQNFLASTKVRYADSLPETKEIIEGLIHEDSPLTQLFVAVAENTDLDEKRGVVPRKAALSLVEKVRKSLRLKSASERSVSAVSDNPVSYTFFSLHSFLAPREDEKDGSTLAEYMLTLNRVKDQLEAILQSRGGEQSARAVAQKMIKGESTELLEAYKSAEKLTKRLGLGSNLVVDHLLLYPVSMAVSVVMGRAKNDIDRMWKAEVYEPCSKSIAGRYPFNPKGEEATLTDLAEFFHPQNGTLWGFYAQEIMPFVEEGKGQWRAKGQGGMSMPFSPEFLYTLQHARLISESLFPRGSSDIKVSFDLYPHPSPGVSETRLQIGGKVLRYRNEPEEWHEFGWPGSSATSGAQLLVNTGLSRRSFQYDGRWGFFKLLDRARIIPVSTTHYRVEWKYSTDGRKQQWVRYDIKAHSYKNPFRAGFFTDFKCLAGVG